MPRSARKKSNSGYLHLIIRGNNKQIIFEDDDDRRFFIRRMGQYCRETEMKISAYCLMENHAHMLVNDPQDAVGTMMKKLTSCYAKYYNDKYERSGHLFRGRYLSEPVDDERYLTVVFRYILNNPRKAGICPASEYRWSSYKAYFKEKTSLDLGFVKDRFPTAEAYREYIGAENEDVCLEYNETRKNGDADAWAIALIREGLGVSSGSELQKWEREKRDGALRLLKEKGLTIRQIERLTGISRNIVQRA